MSILNRASRSDASTDSRTSERQRILVLGSNGHGRAVQAHAWDDLPKGLNVADYDVVILNFASLDSQALAESVPVDRLPDPASFARLLFSPGGEVVAIGDPRTSIGPPLKEGEHPFQDRRRRADYWLPFNLEVEENHGESFSVGSDEWRSFFDRLTAWRWILSGDSEGMGEATQYLAPVHRQANVLAFRFDVIAETRFRKPIATKILLEGLSASQGGQYPLIHSGPAYWLPASDQVSAHEAVDLLLRERYGIAQEEREPVWVNDYTLPSEIPISNEIEALRSSLSDLESQLADAIDRAADAARPKRLLFEKGKEALEPIVRDALRKMGARVEDPEVAGIEDGRLFRDGRAAVVEIKGRDGVIKQNDVRQVVQWASDAQLQDGISYKPLIVGNPYCATRLEERKEPLTGNAKSYAENGGVALLTTVQLYEALRKKQLGELDEDAFWDAVFDANGLVDLPGPEALSGPTSTAAHSSATG